MSLPAETSPAGSRNWRAFASWLWIALLVAGHAFAVYKCIPRDAFDLGERAFAYAMFLGFPLACCALVTVICFLVMGVSRLQAKHPKRWTPWIHMSVLVFCLGGIAKWSNSTTPYNPITPGSEPGYLTLAAVAREHLSGPDSGSWLSLDPSSHEYSESKVPSAVRKQLEQMVPAYWPRYLLHVWIEGECVVLSRGSGMLGEVGVRIYDRGPVALYSADELQKNSFLLKQERITDRLWFFRSG